MTGACFNPDHAVAAFTGVPVTRARYAVVEEVLRERVRQETKWGEQNHPDGTGPDLRFQLDEAGYLRRHGITAAELEVWARARCQQADRDGGDTYERILTEEWAEAIACADPQRLRAELVQVAAVAVAWVEKIDRERS